jgi:hypothetical protein
LMSNRLRNVTSVPAWNPWDWDLVS